MKNKELKFSKKKQCRGTKEKNKPKALSRKKLMKRADDMCSLAIRKIDNNIPWDSGCEGFICNNHLITRGCHKTRFHPLNCFAGTSGANYRHEKNPIYMITWFIKRFGPDLFDELVKLSIGEAKWTNEELKQIYTFWNMVYNSHELMSREEVLHLYNINFYRHGVVENVK
jgi:hypothetical protein